MRLNYILFFKTKNQEEIMADSSASMALIPSAAQAPRPSLTGHTREDKKLHNGILCGLAITVIAGLGTYLSLHFACPDMSGGELAGYSIAGVFGTWAVSAGAIALYHKIRSSLGT